MTVVIALTVLAFIILVHELGHFIAARRIGIPVYEFSLGFGYKLFSLKRKGVEYSLRLIPLGGYVRMAGEEPGDLDDPNGYSQRTPLEKIRVAFAGPFMNFILALLIFVYTYAFIGIPQAPDEPVIGQVVSDKPADRAGLKVNDQILEVNGRKVNTWDEFTALLSNYKAGDNLQLKVLRDNKVLYFNVVPEEDSSGNPVIGVVGEIKFVKQSIIKSIKYGIQQTYQLTVLLLSGLWLLISGGASASDIAGPVGITKLVGEAAQVGTVFLLGFTAFLSINLGIINLLPIPALDGSRIVFALVEIIRRRPLEPEKEGFIHWLGFLFLIFLIIIVTFNDIMKLIKG